MDAEKDCHGSCLQSVRQIAHHKKRDKSATEHTDSCTREHFDSCFTFSLSHPGPPLHAHGVGKTTRREQDDLALRFQ